MQPPISAGNLFAALPDASAEEVFDELFSRDGVRIERIVSNGQSSPPDFWFDQPHHEWVIVLQGEARLEIAGQPQLHSMQPGDYLHLPPHCRHRVDWTTPDQATVWLAVHLPA